MNLKITTYIDNTKFLSEQYESNYFEEENIYTIEYFDKNKNFFKIIIDKKKDNVSIIKDNIKMLLKKEKSLTNYSTDYGVVNLETKLENIIKLEKNSFVQFEINYKLYFSKIDTQNNSLKILIKKI